MHFSAVLQNGIRIVGQEIPHFHSISMGVWIASGSRYEKPAENGISHYIEHMLFKGTHTKSALDISTAMDAVGGQLNAFTGKEETCYYAKVRDAHADLAAELLADMLLHSVFDADEQEKEKKVILEELKMSQDDPEDIVNDILFQSLYKKQTLGNTVLGTEKNILSFNQQAIADYMQRRYTPQNIVLSFAGNISCEQAVQIGNKYFSGLVAPTAKEGAFANTLVQNGKIIIKSKAIEQAHVCVAYPGIAIEAEDRTALNIISSLYGGSMSSRLFQTVREKHGLAYAVYSYPISHIGTGCFVAYAAVKPENTQQVMDIIRDEATAIYQKGLYSGELERIKEQFKGSYILAQESASAKMNSLGRSTLLLGRVKEEDEILSAIDAVTPEKVEFLAQSSLSAPYAVAVVGPKKRMGALSL